MIVVPIILVWRILTDLTHVATMVSLYANHKLLAFCLRRYISDSEGETTMLPITFGMPTR